MSNPFADPQPHQLDSNPFADPAVQQGLKSSAHEYGAGGYDISSTPTPEPSTTAAPAGDVQTRFDDLARREQELASREAALNAKAEHIRRHGRNNWPPGPFPLIFHDIEQEIPEASRSTVLTLYRVWMFLVVTLIFNFIAGILLLTSGANNGGSDLGASLMYVVVITPLSFLLWYRPAYNAYMKELSVFYYMYFLFAGFHLAFSAYMIVGIPSSGSAGLINLISRFASGSIVAGVFCTIATAGWCLQGLASLWMYKQVWAHSHGEKGHTFQQAKDEISMYGLKAYLFRSGNVPSQV